MNNRLVSLGTRDPRQGFLESREGLARIGIRAGLWGVEGATTEALAAFRAALQQRRELGLRFDLALTGVDMIATLGPDVPEAVEAAGQAREILEALGARALLDQLDALERSAATAVTTADAERPA
ncbi:MAG: hypothetical protein U0869_04165 [Chloroflexota bacterium]